MSHFTLAFVTFIEQQEQLNIDIDAYRLTIQQRYHNTIGNFFHQRLEHLQ